jgi:valyl-tRNA synthetase
MPHVAEEFEERIEKSNGQSTNAPRVFDSPFPTADEGQIDTRLEMGELYLQNVIEDVRHILQLLKKERAQTVTFIVHDAWKMRVRALVAEKKSMPAVMEGARKDPELASRMPAVSALAAKLLKNIGAVTGPALEADEEWQVLEESSAFLSAELGGAKVELHRELGAPAALAAKAAGALPNKPSIIIS